MSGVLPPSTDGGSLVALKLRNEIGKSVVGLAFVVAQFRPMRRPVKS
jgi:hypothetical protein